MAVSENEYTSCRKNRIVVIDKDSQGTFRYKYTTDSDADRRSAMTHQQAIQILMLSPVYYTLGIRERMQLIKDYCKQFYELQHIRKQKSVRG